MVLLRFDDKLKEFIKIDRSEKKDGDFYIDGFLKKKLDFAKRYQSRDNDAGIIVDGSEGSGKSNLAGTVCQYLSNNKFDPYKDIVEDHEDGMKKLADAPKGHTLLFDEGSLLFGATDVMRREQKQITKVFNVMRQKNMFFVIVCPSFFRLAPYYAVDRTSALMHVYEKKDERGFFSYFGNKKKSKLYEKGKRNYNSYASPKANFNGTFNKCVLFDKEYERIKEQTLVKALEIVKPAPKEDKLTLFRKKALMKPVNWKKPIRELAEAWDCSPKTIKNDKWELKKKYPVEISLIESQISPKIPI